jgi:S-adenosylmethionine:tRNA ribosyltransferase-isomerase
MTLAPAESFVLPPELEANEPPEARGVAREGVRLVVASTDGIEHTVFRAIGDHLTSGDLLVVNTSATLAAAVDGVRRGEPVVVHFSTALDDGTWSVELRAVDGSGPVTDAIAGERVSLPAGAHLDLIAGYPDETARVGSRLWRACVGVEGPRTDAVEQFLARVGRPITYGYVPGRWPLSDYQTVFAAEPGSAEMPSAARPFTRELVASLWRGGVRFAPIVLHTGVSSQESHEMPLAERFRVPAATARLVNRTRRFGARVVAVGTTVTRALETVAARDGTVKAGQGWTDLVLGPDRPARSVDGIVTGWHAPGASHLLLLEAVAGAPRVAAAYDAALAQRYLWHEFGDSAMLLP